MLNDPYWSRIYAALKGGEFDDIAKKNLKRVQKEEPKDSRPRTGWIPKSQSISSLDYVKIPGPIIKPKTTTFSHSPRKRADNPIPHDNRFNFNPRDSAVDFLDATRFKPFPISHFKKQLARDNKPFVVKLTPATIVVNADQIQTRIIKC